jgi:hypothetical protein
MPYALISHEAIFVALFALLKAATFPAPFAVLSRIPRLPTDLDASQLPALFQEELTSTLDPGMAMPGVQAQSKWKLGADISIYVQGAGSQQIAGEETYIPATALNNAIDAVVAAIQPPLGKPKQTLGGLVQHCEVSGEVLRASDVPGKGVSVSMAVIPIRILAI